MGSHQCFTQLTIDVVSSYSNLLSVMRISASDIIPDFKKIVVISCIYDIVVFAIKMLINKVVAVFLLAHFIHLCIT